MATQYLVKKNDSGGAILYVGLTPQVQDGTYKANPTLATGDVKLSGDGGAFANLGTLPTVTPAAGKAVKITLSQAETNYDNIVIMFSDAAGAEWCDLLISIETVTRRLDDLAFPATSGRSMVVDAAGLVDANAVKIGPTGAGTAQTARDVGASVLVGDKTGFSLSTAGVQAIWDALSSALTTVGSIGKRLVDDLTGDIYGRIGAPVGASISADVAAVKALLPTALVGGRMDSSIGAVASGAIAAASFAANALDAVWSTAARLLTAGTNIVLAKGTGVTGFNDLDAAGVRSAIGMASANFDTQLDALPTNAELATALGTADDAVLAAIAALNNLSQANVRSAIGLATANLDTQLAAIAAYIDTEIGTIVSGVAAVKAKTDSLTFSVAGKADANITHVNEVEVTGDGDVTPWGPTP
jgi:hypothetical protein